MNRRFCYALLVASFLSLFVSATPAADWPQWRGPERTGWVPAGSSVPTNLPGEPKVLWRLDIGGGFSSPVIAHGQLAYLDSREGQETAHLLDAKTGVELWHTAFAEEFGDEWGAGPRSTPILDGTHLYIQSCNGEFRCLNLADGKTVWRTNYVKDFAAPFLGNKAQDGAALRRGYNGNGVIDGPRIILPVGAPGASLACFDKLTGQLLWKVGDDEAAYSSLMIATLAGVKQIVAFTADALMGVDPAKGQVLWRVPVRSNAKRHAATPVIYGDTVTVSSWTVGLLCFKITKEGDTLKTAPLWANSPLKISVATAVLAGHCLYSQGAQRDYVCVDAATGKTLWKQPGFGENVSATIGLGSDLLVQTDRGELVLLAADPEKYVEKARIQICGRTWSHPAYVDGKLYVREGLDRGWKLTCFDLP